MINSYIRRIVTVVEETHREEDQLLPEPVRRAAAAAIIRNPFAGQYQQDLTELVELSEALGAVLAARAIAALGIPGNAVHSYGKAVVVGADGALEHAAALMHPKLGAPFRTALGGGEALIPSAKKRGGMGSPIDIPLGHKDNARVRSHFDAMELVIPDAPRANELVLAIAITDSGRPLPRVGGLGLNDLLPAPMRSRPADRAVQD